MAKKNALSDEAKDKLIAHLQGKAPDFACQVCGHKEFTVGDFLTSGITNTLDGGAIIGGPHIPVASVVCRNCFNVYQFAAVPIGLIEPKKAPDDG